jgi:beta-N-acetylhexosaminidase
MINMKQIIIFSLLFNSLSSFTQKFSLDDFYSENTELSRKVDSIFKSLNDTTRIGQMIVPAIGRLGKKREHVYNLANKGWIGGILLLNGTMDEFINDVRVFDSISHNNNRLPLMFSADAEPTLVNRKILGSKKVPYTNTIEEFDSVAIVTNIISDDLIKIGINQNYAPVIDASPNKVVSNRSFGLNMDTVIRFSQSFITTTQSRNIVATAKHFPGHGYVNGDTHKQLIFIDGEMKEVENYMPLISDGLISIMVAHLAVKNNSNYNTNGLPATCSKRIVSDLLKDSLGFEGLIVTDALNMGAVANIENNGLMAALAGCDQLLMPIDEQKVLFSILNETTLNDMFKEQIYNSVKKIIRIKICIGKNFN